MTAATKSGDPTEPPGANERTGGFDVLGLGCTAVDERLFVAHFPAPDVKARVLRRDKSLGGLTAIALVAAARMGVRAGFAGRLGNDEHSLFVARELQRCGVDTGPLIRCEQARPGHSTIIVDESAGTRAVFSEVAGLRGADDKRPAADLIQRSRVLYLDGHGVTGSVRAARIAKTAGCAIVADFERVHEGDFNTLLHLVDHLVVPRAFATELTGQDDPHAAARTLCKLGCAAVVVTCGKVGGVYCEAGGDVASYAALKVDARDTTGCGDVFHGVYAATLTLGWPIAQRLRYAAAAAALKAANGSGPDSIPNRQEIERLVHSSSCVA